MTTRQWPPAVEWFGRVMATASEKNKKISMALMKLERNPSPRAPPMSQRLLTATPTNQRLIHNSFVS